MSSSKFSDLEQGVEPEGESLGGFEITNEELAKLFKNYENKKGGVKELEKLGGLEALELVLKTDLKNGLSSAEAATGFAERIAHFGTNQLPPAPHKSFLELLWDALQDVTLIILAAAGVLSLILGLSLPHEGEGPSNEWIEGAAILFAVAAVSLVTAGNDYSKDKQFRSLNEAKNNKPVKVIRNGTIQEISIYDINVGEIVKLEAGDQVPADGYAYDTNELACDEASMTGESFAQKKNDAYPFMLSGCQVSSGSGLMMCTGTGIYSLWGETFSKLQTENENTPLQDKLDIMAANIGKVGLFFAIITFLALIIRYASLDGDSFSKSPGAAASRIVDFFIIAVTIVVVAIPEGLPLAVTISLAYSMKKMLKDQNLVRHLAACETMGGATNICSDKTGTLTLNEMTVDKIFVCGRYYEEVPAREKIPDKVFDMYAEGASINSTAFFQRDVDEEGKAVGKWKVVGNKSEGALLKVGREQWPFEYDPIREAGQDNMIKQYSFTSARKRMSTLIKVQDDKSGDKVRIHCKGASEIVLKYCSHYLDENGEEQVMEDEDREKVSKAIDTMANGALRTLVLAYGDMKWGKLKKDGYDEPPEYNLTMICLVGIIDPVRPEVPLAVKQCHEAGVFVRMVTGDNILTAKAIARQCKILREDEGGVAIEGPVFRELSDSDIDSLIPSLQVMARSSPTDKFTLVKHLRQQGEVVAVTGDGTNDAPALKEADIGLAMGIAGTEVAKEASDVIIMDDNFDSIVKAIMWGRCVYDNIRKFIQFQLTVNVVALIVAFVGALSTGESPLTATQLLWVNLIMDTMGALALGTEPPNREELLSRAPYGRFDSLISPIMARNILGQSLYQIIVLFVLLYGGCGMFGLAADQCNAKNSVHYTIIFNAFVWCQVFNEVNSRKINDEKHPAQGLFKNPLFVGILIFTVIFQIFLVEVAQEFINARPLNAAQHIVCIVIGAFSFPLGYFIRLFPPLELKFVKSYREMGTQTTETRGSPIFAGETTGSDPMAEVASVGGDDSDEDNVSVEEVEVDTAAA